MFDKTILRAHDVCSFLNVSLPTLYRWIRAGRFPKGFRYGGKAVGWTRDSVEKWIADQQTEQTER